MTYAKVLISCYLQCGLEITLLLLFSWCLQKVRVYFHPKYSAPTNLQPSDSHCCSLTHMLLQITFFQEHCPSPTFHSRYMIKYTQRFNVHFVLKVSLNQTDAKFQVASSFPTSFFWGTQSISVLNLLLFSIHTLSQYSISKPKFLWDDT